ncbi:exo-beta-1,4-galactosidase [Hymenobacter crusticola]|uniref:beta-galactosidase n=1 Tax=Hymenobacter crusticola TaxID=1770526 RepID=A0A243W9Y5_9BACT|nr:sugar-binding domain-containing protein [Hymenobacter crusticola]OUJ72175.1 beta-glucuronidase [Hymenobacter crusticola]
MRLLFRFSFLFWLSLLAEPLWATDVLPLAGEWRCQLDPQDAGITARWFATRLAETVRLPGSLAENGKGDPISLQTHWTATIYDSSWFFNPRFAKYRQPDNFKIPFWLTPAAYYVGPAWYQKVIDLPAQWRGRRFVLFLERAHYATRVWVDDTEVGQQVSLVAPHTYELTTALAAPGPHTLTVRVDNRLATLNVGPDSHSVSDHIQGNWNGLIGRLELQAGPPVFLQSVQVYPDVQRRVARVRLRVKNTTAKSVKGTVQVGAQAYNTTSAHQVAPALAAFVAKPGETTVELTLAMGDAVQLWDEFHPALYRLTAALRPKNGSGDEQQVSFGMRDIKAVGNRLVVNGRPVFLRGDLHNGEFPLTGYPAMDVPAWKRVLAVLKDYGFNHLRFHSWCPPEAAFVAADEMGFYLQPEGPSWPNHGTSLGDGKPIDQFIYDETTRMAEAYGNHASYCMLSAGNEPAGRNQAKYLADFVKHWQGQDPRRLYTGASVAMSWPLVPENEYMIKSGARGLPWKKERPNSTFDYRAAIEPFKVPYVTHEMGQWCVFPDFKEIDQYTGVYKARNLELFREDLADHGMADQAETFLMASGKLQLLCYKNEIEATLRTPNLAGFQLLGVQDFPGQGTALVGVLNPFFREKAYVTAQQYRRFCQPTVPLARLPKFVFTSDETFEATAELYHYGPQALPPTALTWTIKDASGALVGQGSFAATAIPTGTNTPLGSIRVPLDRVSKATQLTLQIAVPGTTVANDWNFWVYPAQLPSLPTKDVYYCTHLDAHARQVLAKGGRVLLNAAGQVIKGKEVVMNFTPVFWNTSWFKMQPPHVTGFVVNPVHPALADFPTEAHSDLQWWEIVNQAQVMHLEDFPAGFRPIVQPIDTWFLNRRLALVFEARVGAGRLLVTSANLSPTDDARRPAARQLYYSLMRYAQSAQFQPGASVALNVVQDLFETPSREQFRTYTKSTPDELKPLRK